MTAPPNDERPGGNRGASSELVGGTKTKSNRQAPTWHAVGRRIDLTSYRGEPYTLVTWRCPCKPGATHACHLQAGEGPILHRRPGCGIGTILVHLPTTVGAI